MHGALHLCELMKVQCSILIGVYKEIGKHKSFLWWFAVTACESVWHLSMLMLFRSCKHSMSAVQAATEEGIKQCLLSHVTMHDT